MKTRNELSIEIAEFIAKDHEQLFKKLADPDYIFLPRGVGQEESDREKNRRTLQSFYKEMKRIIKAQP